MHNSPIVIFLVWCFSFWGDYSMFLLLSLLSSTVCMAAEPEYLCICKWLILGLCLCTYKWLILGLCTCKWLILSHCLWTYKWLILSHCLCVCKWLILRPHIVKYLYYPKLMYVGPNCIMKKNNTAVFLRGIFAHLCILSWEVEGLEGRVPPGGQVTALPQQDAGPALVTTYPLGQSVQPVDQSTGREKDVGLWWSQ